MLVQFRHDLTSPFPLKLESDHFFSSTNLPTDSFLQTFNNSTVTPLGLDAFPLLIRTKASITSFGKIGSHRPSTFVISRLLLQRFSSFNIFSSYFFQALIFFLLCHLQLFIFSKDTRHSHYVFFFIFLSLFAQI